MIKAAGSIFQVFMLGEQPEIFDDQYAYYNPKKKPSSKVANWAEQKALKKMKNSDDTANTNPFLSFLGLKERRNGAS